MSVTISSRVLVRIAAEARAASPFECCGLLLADSKGGISQAMPARNVAPDPRRGFEVDPATLVAAHRAARAGGPVIAGCYHSHPLGDVAPSPADRSAAQANGWLWIIATGAGLRFGYWRATGAAGTLHPFEETQILESA